MQAKEREAVCQEAGAKLQEMIQAARRQGVPVQTWADEKRGLWGISYVAIKLDNGTYALYSDTAKKLAILQWYGAGR